MNFSSGILFQQNLPVSSVFGHCDIAEKGRIGATPVLRLFFARLGYNLPMDFQLVSSYKPRGDQPRAIEELVGGLSAG
jgi:hypothetical protein